MSDFQINTNKLLPVVVFAFLTLICIHCTTQEKGILSLKKDDHVVLLGNNLCSRMINFGHFETEMHLRYPNNQLIIRYYSHNRLFTIISNHIHLPM